MVAALNRVEERREALVAELAEAAFVAVGGHVRGASVDLEIGLWQALRKAMADIRPGRRELTKAARWDGRLARLTREAYDVALQQGIVGSFLELELAIWKALRKVVWRHNFAQSRFNGPHFV